MSTTENLEIPQGKLQQFCEDNGIQRLAFFGSVLRSDFGSESDVDVLVEFEEGKGPGFFGLAQIERELSELFGGREVYLRTPNELSRYFREEVLRSARVLYAKG
ncbi:nucleotidyltransferase family protein [candidate division KSB1 bacterium]|nr:nucleotidyltransferase family protein [candidate division KSB1 bacterium]NIR69629.1 nucleotidyltransferase family protein [candidate division KSB1 bacterium]NIS25736.1 nucleotidyltransferase family protein [candidate division KSB1 bacterium]NIT72603.1 nucleotidyltransferase family protein [candidate division KSB1 bacterium]NIU26417.1 nucleotidyltransferase family protein [candidate division KSB1 bacterium]